MKWVAVCEIRGPNREVNRLRSTGSMLGTREAWWGGQAAWQESKHGKARAPSGPIGTLRRRAPVCSHPTLAVC